MVYERLLSINHNAAARLELACRLCADRFVKFGREASKLETNSALLFTQRQGLFLEPGSA
jgi:hypothetical protein